MAKSGNRCAATLTVHFFVAAVCMFLRSRGGEPISPHYKSTRVGPTELPHADRLPETATDGRQREGGRHLADRPRWPRWANA